MRLLEGIRVLELSSGIAGAYCTKLLTDAGADTVKLEPAGGDPLRAEGSGALFGFLNASKRSVLGGAQELLAGADVVVADRPLDTAALWRANPALVVVTVTPFGCDGPWVGRPATEFTLQASCGSIGQRGLPDEPPLAAGGRIGEWMTGTYAAVAALAALREAERSGQGEHVDVAAFDCMAVTMVTYPSVFASFMGWPRQAGTGRTVEVPSVEPCADGYVVFTTNSAQQFQDFLVMIGREDWLADKELAMVHRRFSRRREFLEAVHKFTLPRTSEELLEAASLLRIPSGPVLDAPGIVACDHFRARAVLEPAASGAFVQPRPPYRMNGGATTRPPGPVAGVGQHDGEPRWPARDGGGGGAWRLPLEGIRVVDCTAWWAGPSAPCALGALGADVVKVESTARADGMRFSAAKRPPEDLWWEWSALFHAVNVNKRDVTVDLSVPAGRDVFVDLLRSADVLIENYTPRVMENFGLGWDEVHAVNPDLIMVRMPAFGLEGPWRDRTGFAQTMECVSGMAWRTGFPDGPPVLVRGACDPLAGMHAVIATLLALRRRDRDGEGSLVESVMVEAALNAAAEQIVEYSSSGRVLVREGNRGPGAPQGVYRCSGEDRWLAIAVEDDDQWGRLVRALGAPSWSGNPGLATVAGRRAAHDEIDSRLSEWCAGLDADEAAERLVGAGVPAAAVIVPRDVAHNPQLRHRALFETEEHPVTGTHEVPTMPFRFGRVEAWVRLPSPTLGQHNDEVLTEIGYGRERVEALRAAGVVGERLAGY